MVKLSYRSVVVYNSLGQPRTEVIKFWTDWPYVTVTDPDGKPMHSQTEPYWIDKTTTARNKYKVKR